MIDMMKQKKAAASLHTTEVANPSPIISGPSPNAAPVSQQPVQKALVTEEAPKKELTPKEKEE